MPRRLELELDGAGEHGIDAAPLRALVEAVLDDVGIEGEAALGVAFVSDERIRALNAEHRALDEVTDVLSFPIDGLDELPRDLERQLGDVVISPAQALRQAAAAGVEPADELCTLVVHGVLHLVGFDHDADSGEMLTRQDSIVAAAPALRWAAP